MARSSEDVEIYTAKYNAIRSCLNEKGKRLWSAVEAKNYGYGGVTVLSEATKLSRPTIQKGISELELPINDDQRQLYSILNDNYFSLLGGG